jgi:hypothetical protein
MDYIWVIYGVYMEYIWNISKAGTVQIRYRYGTDTVQVQYRG